MAFIGIVYVCCMSDRDCLFLQRDGIGSYGVFRSDNPDEPRLIIKATERLLKNRIAIKEAFVRTGLVGLYDLGLDVTLNTQVACSF